MMLARGFSILEAMVAASILGIVLTSTAGSLALGFRFIADRRLRATNELVVQSHMEMLLALDRERAILPFDCRPVNYNRDVLGTTSGGVTFSASCQILRNTPPTSDQRINRLVVTSTTQGDGRVIKSSYSTYIVQK